jgi:hypothetical protein
MATKQQHQRTQQQRNALRAWLHALHMHHLAVCAPRNARNLHSTSTALGIASARCARVGLVSCARYPARYTTKQLQRSYARVQWLKRTSY